MKTESIKTTYVIKNKYTFIVEWRFHFTRSVWIVSVECDDDEKMKDKVYTKEFYFDTIPSLEKTREVLHELSNKLYPDESDILSTLSRKY